MNLNETQQKKVTEWITEGKKLSEVQSQLATEFGLRLTYMEVRFLVDDLKLRLKDPEPPKTTVPAAPATTPASVPDLSEAAAQPPASAGAVSLSVDQLARPGTLVSGKVTFSDGMGADWYLDQTGRLGVVPAQQGYKPTAGDVQQFQMALEKEMAKMGF